MGQSSNLVVLHGTVTKEVEERTLAAGTLVAQFDVTTPIDDGGKLSNISLPVSWLDPSATDMSLVVVGEAVVVIGSVRRRFFRVGGMTQSRTEVVVDTLIPARRRKTARSAVAAAVNDLTSIEASRS